MFSRTFRLSLRARRRFTQSLSTPLFTLKIAENGLLHNRYAFMVTKKIDRRASVRNRAKRVLGACVENIALELKAGYDLLFILRKRAVDSPKTMIYASVQEACRRGGLLVWSNH